METFLDDGCVTTCDRILEFLYRFVRDSQGRQGDAIAVCHCSSLQIDALPINVQEAMELLLLRITLEGGSAFFLCAAYRPQ